MLTVVFAVFYGIVSFYFCYYGEMITYLGITAPSAIATVVSWLRHPYAETIVLIVLWAMATFETITYLPMVLCFVMFLLNDLYGFYNWRRMNRKQNKQ